MIVVHGIKKPSTDTETIQLGFKKKRADISQLQKLGKEAMLIMENSVIRML